MNSDGKDTNKPDFIVRDAYQSEIPAIVQLAAEFFLESNFSRSGLTVDLKAYEKTIQNYWRYPTVKSIVALCKHTGDLLGYVHVYAQRDYTVELIGELYQFYVRPDARMTLVPRELVRAACAQWDEWGCKRAYAEAAPGLDNEKSLKTFRNLWGKFGFKQIGITLLRE